MKGKYNFPKLEKVILRNFSLYKKNNVIHEVNEKIGNGVFCLAGANGLGKTTFLNAINYGYTGIILEPGKEVFSPDEILENNKKYTERYFNGRVLASEKQKAEIELHFKVNGVHFRIIRGFFETKKLRTFEKYIIEQDKKITLIDTNSLSPEELNNQYETELTTAIEIGHFNFFVFLQLYVLTFDENRRMLFWDGRASLNTLSIAFNANIEDASNAIDLKRKIEKHDSNGRNKRWEATQINSKIRSLKEIKGKQNEFQDSFEKYEQITKKKEKLENIYKNIENEYSTLLKNQSFINADILKLKNEHRELFSKYSQPRSILTENTYIKMSISKKECCLCEAKNEQIPEYINNNLHKGHCPLCGTAINQENIINNQELLSDIEKKDQLIAKKTSELENIILETDEKTSELEKAKYELDEVNQRINELESSNPILFNNKNNKNSDADIILNSYQKQYEMLDRESKEEYKKRDKLYKSFSEMQTKMVNIYKDAQKDFVPIFKQFAKSFIGLDLEIYLPEKIKFAKFVLELQQTARSEASQLSESQRFFLDIALRMALAVYLSKKNNEATLLIDTPEGSLDISYENRAGQMIADFVQMQQNLIMTTNINTSRLLIAMAERCGHNMMTIKRMFDWTDLSTVQKEGESLFNDAYSKIVSAMGGDKQQ